MPPRTSAGEREAQAEARAGAALEEIELSPGLLGEGSADVEAEAGARRAPGDEGAEDARAQLVRGARPFVLDDGLGALARARRGHGDTSALADESAHLVAQQAANCQVEANLVASH